MRKPVRRYYEHNNELIQQYIYIDKLLDSSVPHNLIQEYSRPSRLQRASNGFQIPSTVEEVAQASPVDTGASQGSGKSTPGQIEGDHALANSDYNTVKVKRTPRNIYKIPDEDTPLIKPDAEDDDANGFDTPVMPPYEPEEMDDSGARVVRLAIYLNLAANTILLILKIIVTVLTSSVSVLASLVDGALDFLSTVIVWVTTHLISKRDQYKYPVGRRKLEPVGVLVFSVIMITSFLQVALEGIKRLASSDRQIIQLSTSAIAIMASTVIIKFFCWLWCRLIKNSSVQALAQDAMTDVVFNIFSIIFPLGRSPARFDV